MSIGRSKITAENKKKKQGAKKTVKRTSREQKSEKVVKPKTKSATNSVVKKSTVKTASKRTKATKTAAKSKAISKPVKKAAKKPAAAKTTKRLNVIKHDQNYENSTGGDEKIIVINGKKSKKQTRRGNKQLKRVANIGGFTAWDGRTGKTFATEKEAREYAIDFFARTGEIIAVTRTQRTVSHTFKAENKEEK